MPEFADLGRSRRYRAADGGEPRAEPRRLQLPRSPFFSNAMLALIFTLVGVSSGRGAGEVDAAAIERARTGFPPGRASSWAPSTTSTGEPVLDDDVAQVGARLAESLGKFGNLDVGRAASSSPEPCSRATGSSCSAPACCGTMNWPGRPRSRGPPASPDTEALTAVGARLAEQLRNAAGPLHAPGRAWLKLQDEPSEPVNGYLCELLYMNWRDSRRPLEADAGEWCFNLLRQGVAGRCRCARRVGGHGILADQAHGAARG